MIARADSLFRNDIVDLNKFFVRNQQGSILSLSSIMSFHNTGFIRLNNPSHQWKAGTRRSQGKI